MDVAIHPRFAENRLVYLTYTKPVENGKGRRHWHEAGSTAIR